MTRNEWLKQAEEWETKAREAYERGDTTWAERCEQKASSCRFNADFAQDNED